MPSLLPNRRGSSARPKPVDQNTSNNATVAAASAFLQTSKSTTSLSSAAAAAALRSHTTSPEPVGSVQTKRMTRRGSTASNASAASARGVPRRPSLERSNSNGSMTERTFRAASPAEPSSRTMSLDSSAPPIPPIPKNEHKRASSLDPPMSPASPRSPGFGRISSPPPTTSRQAKRLSNVMETEPDEAEQPASPSSPSSPSRNFSRPMSSQSNTPSTTGAPKKYTHGTGSWYTQPSTKTTPARPMTADGISRPPPLDLSLVGNKPVSKNRISSAPGSHLARANSAMARHVSGPPLASDDDDDAIMVFDKHTRTFIRKPRSQAAVPTSPASPAGLTVYDPHTRSFISKEVPRSASGVTVTPVQQDRVASPVQRPKIARPVESPVEPTLQPPPRHPGRASPDSASSTPPRATQVLHKQPSLVREEPEAEEKAAALGQESTRTVQVTPGLSKATSKAPVTPHQRATSLDVPASTSSAVRGRQSPSPQRSAHFSPSPILKPERHDPMPRDASPVKSALKHSPASSVRTASPLPDFSLPVTAGTVSPPSETSEGAPSQDGLDSGKKKKSVRVSFDERAREIEAPAVVPSSAVTFASEEEDDDATMKPRPALPSFGSVRRNRMQPEVAEKVTEMPPERHEASTDHAIGGILKKNLEPLPPEVTSKETAGYISDESSESEVPAVASAANPKRAEAGAGLDANREGSQPVVKDFASAPSTDDDGKEDADVPAINLLPPTPGVEDDNKRDLSDPDANFKARAAARSSREIVVPGGWGLEDENEEQSATSDVSSKLATSESRSLSAEQPVLHASPLQLSDIDEDSDDSAEFSDAVEDVSDMEDGGFASLDAIVESPIVPTSAADSKARTKAFATTEPPESPTLKPAMKPAEDTGAKSTDWGEATTFWSQLTAEKRQQLEREAMSSDDEKSAPKPATTKKSNLKKSAEQLTALPAAAASRSMASSQQEPAQPAMRKTMRAQTGPAPAPAAPAPASADNGVHMRRSMRSGGGTGPTLRAGPPPRRPQSEYVEPKGTLQRRNIRPMSSSSMASISSAGSILQAQQPPSASKSQDSSFPTFPTKKGSVQKRPDPPQVSARLQKELAKGDDSDSESSFKRRRRGNSGSTMDSMGRYSMRRSMRGGSIDETPTPMPQRPQSPDVGRRDKKGFRLRSLSPPIFGRNKNETPTPASGARTSLRGPPAAKGDNRKSAPAGRATPTARATPSAPSRFKSRFADSDDSDEEAAPSRGFFRSRFADSDDDEPTTSSKPSGLAPVRGIPRKPGQDDGDSTDLSDEDDGPGRTNRNKKSSAIVADPAEIEKAMAAARRNLGMSEAPAPAASTPKTANEGNALAKGSLRGKPEESKVDPTPPTPRQEEPVMATPEKKKRGFMGSILRRNRGSTSSIQQMRPSSPPPPMPTSPAVATSSPPKATEPEEAATPASPSSPATPSPGKLVRRTSNQPTRMNRVGSDFSVATAPAPSSTTTAVGTQNDEEWPLGSPSIPPVPPIPASYEDYNRPETSDGNVKMPRTMRPELGARSRSGPQQRVMFQAGEEGSEPGEREKDLKAVYSRRTGKKKKFGMLRRAFGIDD